MRFQIVDGGAEPKYLLNDPPMLEMRYSVKKVGMLEGWETLVGEPFDNMGDAFLKSREMNDEWLVTVQDEVDAYLKR